MMVDFRPRPLWDDLKDILFEDERDSYDDIDDEIELEDEEYA